MVQILFLDQDRLYCQQVCSQLNAGSRHFQCVDWPGYQNAISESDSDGKVIAGLNGRLQSKAVDLGQLDIAWDSTLVIYHPQQFFHPPENSYTMILNESSEDSKKSAACDSASIAGIYKYDSLQSMQVSIENFLGSHPGLSLLNKRTNLMCVLGAACPAMRKRVMDRIRQEKLELGLKVVQIDFCPPYLGDYIDTPSNGYTLSDAFLRLMADDFSYEDFGIFLVPRSDGTLQFRPIERADDLFECKPAHIRQFVELVRQWIIRTNNQYFVFIQCSAIPFSIIYTIAVLCDVLLLVNQEGKDITTILYNKELGFLLANLPGSCSMEEITISCQESC